MHIYTIRINSNRIFVRANSTDEYIFDDSVPRDYGSIYLIKVRSVNSWCAFIRFVIRSTDRHTYVYICICIQVVSSIWMTRHDYPLSTQPVPLLLPLVRCAYPVPSCSDILMLS